MAANEQKSLATINDRLSRWDIEQQLGRIWHEALKVPTPKRDDDFFALGGDSLAATKVLAAIEGDLHCRLPMIALVENPTIGLLACRIQSEGVEDDGRLLIPIRTTGTRPPLFLVHGLMGHIVFAHVLGRFMGDDQPIYALRAQGFDGQPPHGDVGTMADAYVKLIREVQPHGPYYIGGYCSGSFVAMEMGRRLLAAGEKLGITALIDPLEPGVSSTHWRLQLPQFKIGDEQSESFRSHLRAKLEKEIYGYGGIARQRLEWAIDVATAINVAVAKYQPTPYPSRINVLASRERASIFSGTDRPWRKIAIKGIRLSLVAERHMQVFLEKGALAADVIRKRMDDDNEAPLRDSEPRRL